MKKIIVTSFLLFFGMHAQKNDINKRDIQKSPMSIVESYVITEGRHNKTVTVKNFNQEIPKENLLKLLESQEKYALKHKLHFFLNRNRKEERYGDLLDAQHIYSPQANTHTYIVHYRKYARFFTLTGVNKKGAISIYIEKEFLNEQTKQQLPSEYFYLYKHAKRIFKRQQLAYQYQQNDLQRKQSSVQSAS